MSASLHGRTKVGPSVRLTSFSEAPVSDERRKDIARLRVWPRAAASERGQGEKWREVKGRDNVERSVVSKERADRLDNREATSHAATKESVS